MFRAGHIRSFPKLHKKFPPAVQLTAGGNFPLRVERRCRFPLPLGLL